MKMIDQRIIIPTSKARAGELAEMVILVVVFNDEIKVHDRVCV